MVLGGSGGFGFDVVKLVSERFARLVAGRIVLEFGIFLALSVLLVTGLLSPSPLPSPSFATEFSEAVSALAREDTSILESEPGLRTGPIDGEVGTLLSATVSRLLD